jgi:hypothetical protein
MSFPNETHHRPPIGQGEPELKEQQVWAEGFFLDLCWLLSPQADSCRMRLVSSL